MMVSAYCVHANYIYLFILTYICLKKCIYVCTYTYMYVPKHYMFTHLLQQLEVKIPYGQNPQTKDGSKSVFMI